jgi:thymidylate kinase
MFESLEELKKMRRKALTLALMDRWTIIDAGQPISEVEKDIETAVHVLF